MPIFEFVCTQCGQNFEELVRSASSATEVICPTCHSQQVKKKISTFASKVVGGGASYSMSPACNTGST